MGCGCNKKALNGRVVGTTGNTAGRMAVYEVVDSSNNKISEHSTPGEARKAAIAAGGRVRITSRPMQNVVTQAITG